MKVSFPPLFIISILLICCNKKGSKELILATHSSKLILIADVDIFNGRQNKILFNQDVLIDNESIVAIADKVERKKDFLIINGAGKTLMPGLIDSHVHLSGSGAVPWNKVPANMEYNLTAYLFAGITTVYDLGGLAADISKLSTRVSENNLIGPSIYNTHIPITVKESHPIPLTEQMLPWPLKSMVNAISPTIDKVEEAPHLIKKYLEKDIDYVKIVCDQIPPGSPEMPFDQLKSLIDEVHKFNKKVFVHVGSPENAVNAVKAGADVLAHGIWRGKLSEEQAEIIAASNVPIIYTLSGFKNVKEIYQGKFQPSLLDRHLVDEVVLSSVEGENGKDVHQQEVMNVFFENVTENSTYWKENFNLLHERKVPILVGTDSNLPGTYAGSTYLQELRTLKEFGLSNFEILSGATYLNAKLFINDPDFGSIEVGKKADLLILHGNPLEDIAWIKDPMLIMKYGKIITRIK